MSGDGSGTGIWESQVDLPEEDQAAAVELVIAVTKRNQGTAVELARMLEELGLVEVFYSLLKPHQIAAAAVAFQELHAIGEDPLTKPR